MKMGIFDLFKSNVERLQEKKNVKGLIKALRDKDSDVREEAAEALGEIGDKRAVEPLIQALKDEDLKVRVKAAIALSRIGDERAIKPLNECLREIKEVIDKLPPLVIYSKLGDLEGLRKGSLLIAAERDIEHALSVLERKVAKRKG